MMTKNILTDVELHKCEIFLSSFKYFAYSVILSLSFKNVFNTLFIYLLKNIF